MDIGSFMPPMVCITPPIGDLVFFFLLWTGGGDGGGGVDGGCGCGCI